MPHALHRLLVSVAMSSAAVPAMEVRVLPAVTAVLTPLLSVPTVLLKMLIVLLIMILFWDDQGCAKDEFKFILFFNSA